MSIKKKLLSYYGMLPPRVQRVWGCYNKVHSFYNQAQWWSVEQIEDWQLVRLKLMVEYAYNNTSGYRQLYDEAGVKPSDIISLAGILQSPCCVTI